MNRTLVVLFLLISFGFTQTKYDPEYTPKTIFPFTTGNDTVLSAANLTSSDCYIGDWRGSLVLGVQTDTSLSGNVAKAIDVYAKIKVAGLGYGVPYDSVAVDSLHLGQLDSTHVKDQETVYFDLSNETWWTWTDWITFILDPGAGADSILIKARLKGQ